jgi:protein-S-isoprenylcysteine O-methyltransferase Ste14
VALGFACGALALWLAEPSVRSLAAGGAIACLGEGLRIWAAGHLHKGEEVTVSGPYRFFAHPLYVGSSILGVGFAIASRSVVVAVIVAVYLGATLAAAIRTEEARLRARFGDGYDRYRRGGGGPAAARPFSLQQAMTNREHRAVGGVLLVWLLLVVKATYNGAFG